MAVIKMDTSDS